MLRFGSRLATGLRVYQFAFFNKTNQNEGNKEKNYGQKPLFQSIKFQPEDLKAIDEVNKYFRGIRMNTKYAKFNNEDSYKNIRNFTGRKIADLPFRLDSEKQQAEITGSTSKVCKFILKKVESKQLEEYLLKMSADYFTDLLEWKRTVKIEPNFEREARRVINSLQRDGYKFQLKKNQDAKIKIIRAELYKGLEVNRNNNYSIDSYEIIKSQAYTFYKLWQRGTYKIPEEEWNTQKNILMRITANVTSPYSIRIYNNKQQFNLTNREHTFIFEMDLKKPPRFSQFSLDANEYMKKYEPVISNLTITNVDQRNPFAAFTYEERQKKESLINKLV